MELIFAKRGEPKGLKIVNKVIKPYILCKKLIASWQNGDMITGKCAETPTQTSVTGNLPNISI